MQLATVIDGFSDRIPINIDYTKSPYECGVLFDKYAFVRFWYYGQEDNIRTTHHFGDIKETQRI